MGESTSPAVKYAALLKVGWVSSKTGWISSTPVTQRPTSRRSFPAYVSVTFSPIWRSRLPNSIPSSMARCSNAFINFPSPFASNRFTQCQRCSRSGTSHSSSLTGMMKMVPSGCSSASSKASLISFWAKPRVVTEAREIHTRTTSLAWTAFLIVNSQSSPGTRSSSSNQGLTPSPLNSRYKCRTAGLSNREWQRNARSIRVCVGVATFRLSEISGWGGLEASACEPSLGTKNSIALSNSRWTRWSLMQSSNCS